MYPRNYYALLGLSSSATYTEIKASYRELAKKYHPDKNFDNKTKEEEFKEIQHAYSVLSNHKKRADYDLKFVTSSVYFQQNNYTPYSGNAYQYAQSSAGRKNNNSAEQKTKSLVPDASEWFYVLISVIVAVLLTIFIISNSSSKSAAGSAIDSEVSK